MSIIGLEDKIYMFVFVSGVSLEGSCLTKHDDCTQFDFSSVSNLNSLWLDLGESMHGMPVRKDVSNWQTKQLETLLWDGETETRP